MENSKRITILRAGGTGKTGADVFPGDNVEQLCTLVAPELGWPADGAFELLDPGGNPLKGDVYKAVRDGDEVTLVHTGEGGQFRKGVLYG